MKQSIFVLGLLTLFLCPQATWAAPVGFQAGLKKDIAVKAVGWKQVTQMQTSNAPGLTQLGTAFNEATGVFTAPAKGHYLVSGLVRLLNAEAGPASRYMRAQVAINGSTEINNGMMTIQGGARLKVFTLRTSGVLALNQGDKVTLWVFSSSDADYTIQQGTRFSVMQINPALTQGFHADLNSSLAVQAKGWRQVTSWRTTGTAGLFKQGSGFNATTGEYTVPVSGYYFLSTKLRIDLSNSGYYQAHIAIGNRDNNNGLIATSRHGVVPYHTVELSGVVYLKKGEKVTVWVFSSDDSSYAVESESGFSCALLSTTPRSGFHLDLNAQQTYTYNSWNKLKGWRFSGTSGLFTSGTGLNAVQGTYTVPTTGYYYLTSQTRLNNLNQAPGIYPNQASYIVDVSNQIVQQAMLLNPKAAQYSMGVEGLFYFKKGDIVSVQAQATYDNSFIASSESSFSMVLMQFGDEDKDGVTNDKDCDDFDKTVYPGAPELCDNKDNNCNKQVDDVKAPCTVPGVKGVCQTGEWSCGRGLQKYCRSKTLSQIEICDNKDNSCDGIIDNVPGLGQPCKVAGKVGLCNTGTLKCDTQKKTTVCQQTVQPTAEICDGKDNDCDGKVDNLKDLGQPCTDPNRKGICGPGTWLCLNNKKICQAFQVPTRETCNGKDSDCDGQVDNIAESGKACILQAEKGECRKGTWTCSNNTKICQKTTQPGTETCNGKDDDCDGKIDNIADFGKACTDNTKKGECQNGTWTCSNNAKTCLSTAQPAVEVCDQKDNDCDGQVDNGVCKPDGGNGCPNGCPAGQTCQNGTCQAANPCASTTCLPGEFCREGSCFPSCGCIECAKGNTCIDGACRADICGGITCPTNQTCSPTTGACEPDPCKGVTCQAGTICEAGSCVTDPCSVVQCSGTQICVKGQCYDKGCEPGAPPKQLPDGGTLPPPPTSGCNATIQWEPSLPAVVLVLLLLLSLPLRRKRRQRSHL